MFAPGRIDVGLLRPPVTRGEFSTLKVASESLVAALPLGDDRLEAPSLTLKDFHGQPTIMYAPEGARYFHDRLAGLFAAADVTPVHIQPLSQIHSMLALVRAGVRQFQVGSSVRPSGSWAKSYVDAAHVRVWRMLLDYSVEHVRGGSAG